jgi:hypothetical protein
MAHAQEDRLQRTPPAKDPERAFFSKLKPAHSPRPTTPDLDPPGAGGSGLTPEEIRQFRTQGFVIKRGLLDAADFEPFIDLWWAQPPVRTAEMRRADPASWVAPGARWPEDNRWGVTDNWMGHGPWPSLADARVGANVGERVGRLPFKLTRDLANDVWRWHGIGHDPEFVAATSAHPRMLSTVEALLGGPIKRPRRNRGIYAIFPRDPSGPASRLGPHMDENMTELMAVTYLEDVAPRSGGFTIYPASPQQLYPTSEQALNWVPTARSQAVMDDIIANTEPLDFVGKAGDTVFCHGWMVHSAGIHETGSIRMAVVHDFNKVRPRGHMRWMVAGKHGGGWSFCNMDGEITIDAGSGDDPADGLREVTNQWIIDSNEYVLSRVPPFADMFEEWNLGRDPVGGHVLDEPAWWDKYDLPLLSTKDAPRGGGGMPAVPLAEIATYQGDGVWRVRSRANDWMEKR